MTKTRIVWPDIAKGISILGVVLFHAVLFSGTNATNVGIFSDSLMPLRMGLFFLVSGMFAHRIREWTLSTVFQRRLWNWLVPYLAWSVLSWFVRFYFGNPVDRSSSPFMDFIIPTNGMWFLFALSIFTVFIWLTRNLNGLIVIWLSVMLSVGIAMVPAPWSYARSLLFLPFFCIGLFARKYLLEAEHVSAKTMRSAGFIILLIVAILGYAGAIYIQRDAGFVASNPAMDPLLKQLRLLAIYSLGIAFGVFLCVFLSKSKRISQVLLWYGQHTLPIYLINESLTWVVVALWRHFVGETIANREVVAICVFALVLLGCHGAVAISKTKTFRWVFYPPSFESIAGRFTSKRTGS